MKMKLQLCTPNNAGRYIPANKKEIEFRMNRNREEEKGKKGVSLPNQTFQSDR
jgi:hypothetical protein